MPLQYFQLRMELILTMDFRIKIFYKAAQLKSFTKAAQVLNLTQPAVTFQVKALEDEFNTLLFNRDLNRITLTHSGKILFHHAEKILNEYQKAFDTIGKVTGTIVGGIRIGAGLILGEYILPRLIGHFKQKYPDIEVSMLVGGSAKLIEDLRQGALDLIIVSEPISTPSFIVRPFIEDELIVIVNPQHKWAKGGMIEAEELLKEPIVFRESGSGTREVVTSFLKSNNISVKDLMVAMTMGSFEAVKSAVESGFGYGFVSKISVRRDIELGLLNQIKIRGQTLKIKFLIVKTQKIYNKLIISRFLDFIINLSSTVNGPSKT